MTKLDIDHLRQWIGRPDEATDTLTPELVGRFCATLGCPLQPDGQAAPLAVHWGLAPPAVAAAELGEDGYPARGGFLTGPLVFVTVEHEVATPRDMAITER